MISSADLAKKVGRLVLFIGTEAYTWGISDYVIAARNARSLGFDTICPKVADGGNRWYGNTEKLEKIRKAVLAEGCGFLGLQYLYGPVFGDAQIKLEATVAKEIAGVCDNLVCLDLEAQWNGADAAAQELANQFAGTNVEIILSTWADPVQQNWQGVIRALDPVVAAWGPQEYTTWLTLQEAQFTAEGVATDKLFPAIDIADVFAGSNPLEAVHNVVSHGHETIWVWEYQALLANATVLRTLINLLPKSVAQAVVTIAGSGTPVPSAASFAPVSNQPALASTTPVIPHTSGLGWANYTVGTGDDLSNIAARLGIANWNADLYIPNRVTLDAVARANGASSSQGGNLIYPGTVLKYPVLKS